MAGFLLAAMPFTGHVTPMAAVARALAERGHRVRFYTGGRFRAQVESAGAVLVPWRAAPDFDENALDETFPRLRGRKGMRQLFVNVIDCFVATAPAQVADLDEEFEREPWDALAADETSIGAVLFSERNGSPWSTVAVIPLNVPGKAGPPSGLGVVPGTNGVTRARDAVLRALVPAMSRPISTAIAAARHEVGLPPTRLAMDRLVFSRTLIAASGSPSLDYGRSDRPPHLHFVGRLSLPERVGGGDARLPAWWPELSGRTVVLVTQGTQNLDPADLLRPALEALADREVLVVATTGVPGRDTLPFPVPPNARVAGFLPFPLLLPHVDAMVTNGGWGGVLAALTHGIPLVVAGGDLDKPEVAARVAWSGAGVNLRTGTPSARAIAAGVDRVLAEPGVREAASRVGAELRRLGGAERVAALLESRLG